jgi:hypothetical protein
MFRPRATAPEQTRRDRDVRLLVLGGLGQYPERLSTFLKAGHRLWYASTHPHGQYLPAIREHLAGVSAFELGNVPADPVGWVRRLIDDEQIEVVYSLLNAWDGSNQATAALLWRNCPVPVVRHYKEHLLTPSEDEQTCMERSAGVIFINAVSRDYFAGLYRLPARTMCLDADTIPSRYLTGRRRPKLSAAGGPPHLLLGGSATDDGGRYDYRQLIRELASLGAHVHIYGHFRRLDPSTGALLDSPEAAAVYRDLAEASPLVHIHSPISPDRIVEAWSVYDAGLLHAPAADDRFRPMNFPNRYSAYVAAGVPVALPRNEMPALQAHLQALHAVVVYDDPADLVRRLPDTAAAAGAYSASEAVTFEALFPMLIAFIESCRASQQKDTPAA